MVSPAQAYDSYLVPAMFEPWSRDLLARAAPRPGERALDVACGTGVVACQLAAGGGHVTGLDLSAAMLGEARRRAAAHGVAVTWIESSALAMPLPDASFELITCQQGLQFFPDRVAGARELRRVLAPGGRAVVACWAGLDANPGYAWLNQGLAPHFDGPPIAAPFTITAPGQLRAILDDAGFADVVVETVRREVRFPQPHRFVELSIRAAVAVMPALVGLPAAEVEAKVAQAAADGLAALAPVIEGDEVVFPMTSWLATARA